MFKLISHSYTEGVSIFLDGKELTVPQNFSVASILLMSSNEGNRLAPNDGGPRSPHCMIGNCYECLVEIDGMVNQQSCLIEVKDGMRIRRQINNSGYSSWRSSDD